ncbi:MAG: DksA/TraR family C4-type zinc finger protein [Candidatus Adiutrix sp.]|jgi:phage/conjugal plasmid C-4 type zinc finger TraR family protein|nr:DksA/TraR family C4-type zinc finger protein [Candidatus Adiutrix sp.]
MAVGWAGDGAVQEQITASIEDAAARARERLPQGESALVCEECGAAIPEGRRLALPGVKLCVPCQSETERGERRELDLYNRRGSKNSQIR